MCLGERKDFFLSGHVFDQGVDGGGFGQHYVAVEDAAGDEADLGVVECE